MYRFYFAFANGILAILMAASIRAAEIPSNLVSNQDFYKTATPAEVRKTLRGVSLQGVSVAEENYTSLTPLMRAAKDTPYPEVIDLLVKAGCDVNAYSQPPQTPENPDPRAWQNERTALHFAVQNPNPQVLRALLAYKPDLEAQAHPGFTGTAIYTASQLPSRFEHFMLLLAAGADVTKDYSGREAEINGRSPLWRNFVGRDRGAASEKYPLRDLAQAAIMAKALLAAGSKPDESILGLALYGGQNEVARLLLASGVSPKNNMNLIWALNRPGAHAHSEIPYTAPDIMQILIANNDVNYKAQYEEKPLLLASQSGADAAVVRMLIEAGATLTSQKAKKNSKQDGFIPNTMLVEVMKGPRDNPQLVNYLLSLGLSPTGGTEEPLVLSARGYCRKPLSARELVKAGASPDILLRENRHGDRDFLLEAGILDRFGKLLLPVQPSPAIVRQQKAEHEAVLAWAKGNGAALYHRGVYVYLTPDEVRDLVGRKNLSKTYTYTTRQRPPSYGGVFEFLDWLRPDEKKRHETTAIIEAAMFTPYPEVIDILAKAGCDASALDSKAALFALSNSNPDVLGAIVRHGGSVQGLPPSYIADGVAGHIPILLAAGWDIQKEGGKTMLEAADDGNIPMVRALMRAGANMNEANSDGKRPLTRVIENRDYELALEMMDAGADYTYKDRYGFTLLHVVEQYTPQMELDKINYDKLIKRLK